MRVEGVHVEEQRPGELDDAAPPVDPARLERDSRSRRRPPPPGSRSALNVSTHCSAAADVKKIEPTKNTIPSAAEPTSSTKPGNGADEEAASRRSRRARRSTTTRGAAPTTRPRHVRAGTRACDASGRLHSRSLPSGSRNVTCVVNGPADRRATASQPSGVSGYAATRLRPGAASGGSSRRSSCRARARAGLCRRGSWRFRSATSRSARSWREAAAGHDAQRREVLAVRRERVRGHLPAALAHRVRDVEDREVVDVVAQREREHRQLVAPRDQLERARARRSAPTGASRRRGRSPAPAR